METKGRRKPKRKPQAPPDWPAIRRDYEKSRKSVRWLADWYKLSHTAINKRVKAENWQREVSTEPPPSFQQGPAPPPPPPKPPAGPPEQLALPGVTPLISAAAVDPSAIVDKGRNLIDRLLTDLAETVEQSDAIVEEIATVTAQDADASRRAAMMKAVTLPVRAAALKNLASALKSFGETVVAKKPTGKFGKKDAQRDAASAAATGGRFATPPPPPRLVVANPPDLLSKK